MKVKKIVTILAGIALVVFGITFFYTHLLGEQNVESKSINTRKRENITDINNIAVEVSKVDINFISDERSDVKIIYDGKIKSVFIPELKTKKSGNTLYIYADDTFFSKNLGIINSNLKLNIYIPKSYSENINVSCTSGDINMSKIKLKNLILKATSGDIKLNDIFVNNLKVKTTSGNLNSKNISSDELVFDATSGDIEIEKFSGNTQVDTTSGDMKISYVDYSNDIYADTTSGDVNITLPKKSEFQFDAKTNLGDLKCDFPIKWEKKAKKTFVGKVGSGKNKINIDTNQGDISINCY